MRGIKGIIMIKKIGKILILSTLTAFVVVVVVVVVVSLSVPIRVRFTRKILVC